MQLTLEKLCKGMADTLKEAGHENISYNIEESPVKIVSGETEYYVKTIKDAKDAENETKFEITCNKEIDDCMQEYIQDLEVYSTNYSFRPEKKITLWIKKQDEKNNT